MLTPNVDLIIKTVKKMGGKIKPISVDRYVYEIKLRNKVFIFASKFSIKKNSISSPLLSRYKDLTYTVLHKKRIRMPKTAVIKNNDSKNKIIRTLSFFNFPIIIKDAQGSESKGVFSNVRNQKEALQIIDEIKNKYTHLIIQERASGQEYRVLILDNKVLAALNFIPPFIVGNGKNTVRKLIEKMQKNTPEKTPLNKHLLQLLKQQGEDIDTIPTKNKKIYIRKNACLAEGGTSVDVTEKINPQFAKILSEAARSLGLKLAGIDVFCENIETAEKNYQLIEVNGKPDLYIHHKPTKGKKRNVIKEILNHIITHEI